MSEKTTEETISELMNLIFGKTTPTKPAAEVAAEGAAPLGALRRALIEQGFGPDEAFTIVHTILEKS